MADWEGYFDESGDSGNESMSESNIPSTDQWIAIFSNTHQMHYYFNPRTRTTTWNLPKEVSPSQVRRAGSKKLEMSRNNTLVESNRRNSAPELTMHESKSEKSAQKPPKQRNRFSGSMPELKATKPEPRERIRKFSLPIEVCVSILRAGQMFIKYGLNHKNPHYKVVSANTKAQLQYHDLGIEVEEKQLKFLEMNQIISLHRGKITATWRKRRNDKVPENLCFSIVSPSRTLDLRALNNETREIWLVALASVLRSSFAGTSNQISLPPDLAKLELVSGLGDQHKIHNSSVYTVLTEDDYDVGRTTSLRLLVNNLMATESATSLASSTNSSNQS